MNINFLPTFIIIGAAKSGTTALYEYLQQHPQVFMSEVKEPHYFCYEGQKLSFGGPPTPLIRRSVTELDAYHKLFEDGRGYKAAGEASPFYLYLPQTAAKIHEKIPDVRLIAILRNPIDRAFSNYQFLVRDGREKLDLRAALAAESQRVAENWEPIWHYVQLGNYAEQLERYLALFGREQLHLILYDDFNKAPEIVMREIFQFIGVDPSFEADMSYRPNLSGKPKSRLINDLTFRPNFLMSIFKNLASKSARKHIKQIIQKANFQKIPFDPAIHTELKCLYRPEIIKLQDLLQRDLSRWLTD